MQYHLWAASSLDPYWNLALEELLIDQVMDGEAHGYLWRSTPSVVIGKNQNPWRECDLAWMEQQGIALARRVSGGGAVYHDEGNLNYALALPRWGYREEDVFAAVIRGLSRLGIVAEQMNRTSLAVAGKKISGTAFCYRKNVVLHHGTLLVNADLERLRRALKPPAWEIDTKAIASIPASVGNLVDFDASLTVERVANALCDAFAPGVSPVAVPPEWTVLAAKRAETLRVPEWLYGHTPAFTVTFGSVKAQVEKGQITQIEGGNEALIGSPFYRFAQRGG